MIRTTLTTIVLLAFWPLAAVAGNLEKDFRSPPEQAKPWAYWWWLRGNVSKPGITRDLEEFKRQGIAGVVIFHSTGGAGPMPAGVRFLTPEWKEFFRHTLQEAQRLGMTVGINICDGWDCGGPWITPEQANKKLAYSEVQADIGREVARRLPQPPTVDGYYRDVAVVAFRTKPDCPPRPAEVTASSNLTGYCDELNYPPSQVADGDPETCWSSANAGPARQAGPTAQQPMWLSLGYHEPLPAVAVYVVPGGDSGPRDCELQASPDGKTFATVCRFTLDKGKPKRVEFSAPPRRYFRLLMVSAYASPVRVAEVTLLRQGDEPNLRPGIKWWLQKSGQRAFWDWPAQGTAALDEEYAADGASDCRSREVVDLTSRMDAGGNLAWDAPPGRWTILRFGYTLLGQRTRATFGPPGYEADVLDSPGIESQFKNLVDPLLAISPESVGRSLKVLHIDSYELGADTAGLQPDWSAPFRAEFQRRRGYDLLPYLPALAGRIVDGRQVTDRFLWDVRRTIGDLMAEKFWARFAQLTHARGLKAEGETGYGSYPLPQIDALECAGHSTCRWASSGCGRST